MDRYDQKNTQKKRKKPREDLKIGESVYLLSERKKKKVHQATFTSSLYKISATLTKKQYIQ